MVVEAAPGIILSVIAGVVPALVTAITKFEAYDFESDMIDQQILRIYLMNIINVVIFLLTQIQHMYKVTIIEFNAKSTHTHEIEKVIPEFLPASEYDCVEDEVAMTVVYTVLVGVASKLVTIFVGLIVSRVKHVAKFKESGSPFKIPDEIVWLFSI